MCVVSVCVCVCMCSFLLMCDVLFAVCGPIPPVHIVFSDVFVSMFGCVHDHKWIYIPLQFKIAIIG